ncbi:MAG: hypothetical protein KAJ01_03830 [Candidatus Hydrogenedentes bacterium]|nr:hypothetical protein [Candidatus Hydrogenedentota bacterium]
MAEHQWEDVLAEGYDAVEQHVAQLVESVEDIRYTGAGEFQGFEMHSPGEGADAWVGSLHVWEHCTRCDAYLLSDQGGDYIAVIGGSERWRECEDR